MWPIQSLCQPLLSFVTRTQPLAIRNRIGEAVFHFMDTRLNSRCFPHVTKHYSLDFFQPFESLTGEGLQAMVCQLLLQVMRVGDVWWPAHIKLLAAWLVNPTAYLSPTLASQAPIHTSAACWSLLSMVFPPSSSTSLIEPTGSL